MIQSSKCIAIQGTLTSLWRVIYVNVTRFHTEITDALSATYLSRQINTTDNVHCVSKNVPPLQLAIIFTYTVSLRQFLAQMLPRKHTIKVYFIFPRHIPHLTCAFAIPWETGNPEIASFHLNAACFFIKKHEPQLKISPGPSWTTLHCQKDRLDAPDRT